MTVKIATMALAVSAVCVYGLLCSMTMWKSWPSTVHPIQKVLLTCSSMIPPTAPTEATYPTQKTAW